MSAALLVVLLLFLFGGGRHDSAPARAAAKVDLYVAQTSSGSGNGSSCANAKDVTFFNNPSSWGAGAAIGPGKAVGLCGTITTRLTVRGDGASGHPVTIRFQPGAKLSQPVCPTTGCLALDGHSYIVVDGGANGIIENTDNGTNRGHQLRSAGIEATPCNHCEIRNLTIQNIYVRTGTGSEVDNSGENDIKISGIGVSVHDNVMHDASWALRFLTGGDTPAVGNSGRFYNNDIYHVDHGFILTGPNGGSIGDVFFYGNHLHDFANWDSSSNSYHHDGIHCFTNGTTGMTFNLYLFNNVFDGNLGNNSTTWIFMEGSGSGTACSSPQSHMWFFNNVFHSSGPKPATNTMIETNNGIVFTANNTEIFNNPSDTRGQALQAPKGSIVVNNVAGGFNKLIKINSGTGTQGAPAELDHNAYTFCPPGGGARQSYNCFNGEKAWATYHARNEPHSVANVNSTDVGSNAAGAGKNLAPMCKGPLVPLCRDIHGALRPLRMAPDAGAYQSETAEITSRQIGNVRIGASSGSVEKLYGKKRTAPSKHPIFGVFHIRGARTAKYRRHRGLLSVSYVKGKVAAVATTSRYYTTVGGLGVGADARNVGRGWKRCGRGLVRRRRGTAMVIRVARGQVVALLVARSTRLACRAGR